MKQQTELDFKNPIIIHRLDVVPDLTYTDT